MWWDDKQSLSLPFTRSILRRRFTHVEVFFVYQPNIHFYKFGEKHGDQMALALNLGETF